MATGEILAGSSNRMGDQFSDQQVREALAQFKRAKEKEAAERLARYVHSQAIANKLMAPVRDIVTSDKRYQEVERELRALIESRKAIGLLPEPPEKIPGLKPVPRDPQTKVQETPFPAGVSGANTGDTATVIQSKGHLNVHSDVKDRSGDAWAYVGFQWQAPANGWMHVRTDLEFTAGGSTATGLSSASVDGWLKLQVWDVLNALVSYPTQNHLFSWYDPAGDPGGMHEVIDWRNWTVDGELPLTGFQASQGGLYFILASCEVSSYAGGWWSSAEAQIIVNVRSISIEPG